MYPLSHRGYMSSHPMGTANGSDVLRARPLTKLHRYHLSHSRAKASEARCCSYSSFPSTHMTTFQYVPAKADTTHLRCTTRLCIDGYKKRRSETLRPNSLYPVGSKIRSSHSSSYKQETVLSHVQSCKRCAALFFRTEFCGDVTRNLFEFEKASKA